jgi:transposase, IS5 family
MSRRSVGQLSLADSIAGKGGRSGERLSELDRLVDWRCLERVMAVLEPSLYGAPGYPPLLMLKGLLLQQWYGLSDPGLEDALADRLSFRRFVGLALDEAVPDHSTICRFRRAFREAGLAEAVFAEINRQIDAKGLILRRGTLIDATLVPANVKRPAKPKAAGSEGAGSEGAAPDKPASANETSRSARDPEAEWTKKNGKAHFGYKGHVGVDEGSGIIRSAKLTGASVNDTVIADALIPGDERAVYADQAYSTHARRAALRARGCKDRIMHRANKHHALTARQKQRNRGIAKRRAPVERVFAVAKRLCQWTRVRYLGLTRNAAHFLLLCTAINLRRWAALAA